MKIEFFRKIWWKMLIYHLFVIFITVMIFYVLSTLWFGRFAEKERRYDIDSRLMEISDILSKNIPDNGNTDQLIKEFNTLAGISGLYLQLYNPEGEIIARSTMHDPFHREMQEFKLDSADTDKFKMGEQFSGTKTKYPNGQDFYYVVKPIRQNGRFIGSLLTLAPTGPPPHLNRLIVDIIIITFIVAMLTAIILSGSFTRPISMMEKAAESIAAGDFSHRMNLKRKDELGSLARAFDEMSSQIEKNINSRIRLMRDISHELNTPLASIQAAAEAISDGVIETEEMKKKYLESILNQIRRLSFLLEDVNELTKFEAGEVKINLQPFEVVDPINRAVEAAFFSARKKDVKIDVEVENENLKAIGDSDRILQVIQNLVNNAIQHNPPGIQIKVSAYEKNNSVFFSVADNGHGIPSDEIDNIFNRFHKVDKSRTSNIAGSGLGLAIVKEIMEAHGSDVSVKSDDKGTSFHFYLPAV